MTDDYEVILLNYPTQRVKQDLDLFFMKLIQEKDDESYVPWFAFPEWDNVIRQALSGRVIRLIVKSKKDKSAILATASFTLVDSYFFPKRLTATGFFTGGNCLWLEENALRALLKQIQEIAHSLKVQYIEFKETNFPDWVKNEFNMAHNDNIYASFQKQFIFDKEQELLEKIPRKKRADIRKALANHELEFREDIPLDDFYKVYATSQRNLGTPVQHKFFYGVILSQISGAKLWGIYRNGEILASSMSIEHNQNGMVYYAGALPEARSYHAYDLLYFKILETMQIRGREYFDFGRSKYNTGAFDYKKFWGFEPKAIAHYFMPILAKEIKPLTPQDEKYQKKIALWKKLPLRLANFLSLFVMKGLG